MLKTMQSSAEKQFLLKLIRAEQAKDYQLKLSVFERGFYFIAGEVFKGEKPPASKTSQTG